MSSLGEKVQMSIQRLKAFEPDEGYSLQFSGGKDSVVVKAIADMAGVKYRPMYRLTSVDQPEVVRFIKEKHPDVFIDIPRYNDGKQKTMWNLIVKNRMPPTQLVRYCCEELKESGGKGELTVTGVRWAESINRQNQQGLVTIVPESARKKEKLSEMASGDSQVKQTKKGGLVLNYDNSESQRIVNQCYRTHKTLVNPIIDWEDRDVWDFIRSERIPYCGLYDEGYHRVGCIGCPMARIHRNRDFARYPTYKKAYIHAFDRMLEARDRDGLKPFGNGVKTGEDVFHWWMKDGVIPGQIDMFGDIDDIDF